MRYIALILFLSALACNPVKKALRDKERIDAAIAEWILDNPMRFDTLYVPGDTITLQDTIVNIISETDTLVVNDTIRISSVKWREIVKETRIVDTIKMSFVDDRVARTLQKKNSTLEGQVLQMEKDGRMKTWWLTGLAVALGITSAILIRKGFR